MNSDLVLVSILCITYNHEKFIRDALDGFLQQKTDFAFEIVIGEDCSKDLTRKICESYANRFPIIKLLPSKKNIGMIPNFIRTMQACKGDYIALCEGDDYWTDPYKLQKQIDILENDFDKKIVAVVTNASKINNEGMILSKYSFDVVKNNVSGTYSLHDFFQNNHQYPTLTVVFRNIVSNIFHSYNLLKNDYLGDWTLFVLLHMHGNFYYLHQNTGTYRINENSITHKVNAAERWKHSFIIFRQLKEILPKEYHKYLKDYTNHYIKIAISYKKNRKYMKFLTNLAIGFAYNPITFLKIMTRLIRNKARL
jgi:glycosyltransferase involved in cell wall biosynthesis